MVLLGFMEKAIEIPEGVKAEKKGNALEVSGPKGSLQREFFDTRIKWEIQGSQVKIKSRDERKRTLALTGTFASHMKNMIIGVTSGFEARLKVIYSHFPMKIKVEGSILVIQNFMGGRDSRKTSILEGVKVEVKKDDIIVSGASKEDVGQTAGRIEGIAKVTGFDRRVFQDGIHLTVKTHPLES